MNMLTPSFLVPVAVSIGVPAAFLCFVRRLDLYASGGFWLVVGCFVAGLAAFPLSFAVNTGALRLLILGGMSASLALLAIKTSVAPVVEEVGKSLGLIYSVRRPEFTYFVDGAIFGFAAGTAFAIIENLFYLGNARDPLGMAVNRAFSTSLMHGTASALVGVALGRLRFGHGRHRFAALLVGWASAMTVHMAFNRLVNSGPLTSAHLAGAIAIGLGGVALTAALIFWGLREERAWLRETLGLDVGVSAGEANVVHRMADLDTLLAPVEAHFGAIRRKQVQRFLQLQAQLGLKRKAAALATDARLREALEAQARDLQAQTDALRRDVGIYCMAYVRSILPAETEPIWDRLTTALAQPSTTEPSMNLWQALADRTEAARPAGDDGPAAVMAGPDR